MNTVGEISPDRSGRGRKTGAGWDCSSCLGQDAMVQNKYEQNKSLYSTIQLEKWAIYGIFSLILLVAAFNMIGALSMLVLEKKKDIQVLQAMGAEPGLIRKIFLSEGLLLALIGACGGIIVALILYYLQVNYKLVPLQGESFLIDHYPVKLVFRTFCWSLELSLLLACWHPGFPLCGHAESHLNSGINPGYYSTTKVSSIGQPSIRYVTC